MFVLFFFNISNSLLFIREMLRKQQHSLLTHAELESLWMLLAQSVGDQEEEKMNYETFCNVRDAIYGTIQNEGINRAKKEEMGKKRGEEEKRGG